MGGPLNNRRCLVPEIRRRWEPVQESACFSEEITWHGVCSSRCGGIMIQLHKILVVTDFAPATGAALEYGRELARTFGAQLHLLHVTENPFLRPSTANPHADHLAMFRALHERFTARDRAALSPHVAFGLLSEVEISRGDSSPLERQQESASFSFGNGSELARSFGAQLVVLHVVENLLTHVVGGDGFVLTDPDLQAAVEAEGKKRVDGLISDEDRLVLRAQGVIVTSNAPAFAIVDYAKSSAINLIVIGTHGRGAMAHLLMGSVAEHVVRIAPCPVLTV